VRLRVCFRVCPRVCKSSSGTGYPLITRWRGAVLLSNCCCCYHYFYYI